MYHPAPTLRERALPLAAVVMIHIGLGYWLLHLSGADVELTRQADLLIFNVAPPLPPPEPPPPPPPPVVERVTPEKAKPKQAAAAPAPKNIASRATPVVVPKPRIVVPAPSPVVATTTPSTGAAPTQGASSEAGPGTGAGGSGSGTGSGGSGDGAGGGGNGLGEARARLAGPSLGRRDFPPRLYAQAPRGGTVFLILRIGPDGVPLSCRVTRSFGDAELDALTCRLAVERLRYSPGRDERGRAVADFVGYAQTFNTRF